MWGAGPYCVPFPSNPGQYRGGFLSSALAHSGTNASEAPLYCQLWRAATHPPATLGLHPLACLARCELTLPPMPCPSLPPFPYPAELPTDASCRHMATVPPEIAFLFFCPGELRRAQRFSGDFLAASSGTVVGARSTAGQPRDSRTPRLRQNLRFGAARAAFPF